MATDMLSKHTTVHSIIKTLCQPAEDLASVRSGVNGMTDRNWHAHIQ